MLGKMFYSVVFAICVLNHVKADQTKIPLMPDMAAKALPAAINCITETGANYDVLVKFIDTKPVNNEHFIKFLHCTFNKMGLLEDNGLVKIDNVLKAFPESYESILRKVFEECNKIAASAGSPAETAGKIFFCYIEKSPVLVRF